MLVKSSGNKAKIERKKINSGMQLIYKGSFLEYLMHTHHTKKRYE